MPPELSKSQIDKLGKRLRDADPVTADDLASLQTIRTAYSAARTVVVTDLHELLGDVKVTARIKTSDTLLQKLKRPPHINLSRIQDVAGVRIVADLTRNGQDRMVERIAEHFSGAKIIDRRATPTHAYRAVHIVVRIDSLPVEIQVRTRRQDGWAQMCERLADRWGRQIRYGEPPTGPDMETGHGGSRSETVTLVQRFSEVIAVLEDLIAVIERDFGLEPQQAVPMLQEAERQLVLGPERVHLRAMRRTLEHLLELEREIDRTQAVMSSMIMKMTTNS